MCTAFEHAPWVSGGFEFTTLNETRYCTQRPALANSSFSIDTASWTPADYDLHYQTIIWTGVNGVEMNSTDPDRVELCITAPYTSTCTLLSLSKPSMHRRHKLMGGPPLHPTHTDVTAETITVIQVVASNSTQGTPTAQVSSALTTLTPGTPRPNPVNDVNTNSDDGYTSGMPRPNPIEDVNTNTDEGYATAGVAKVASAPSATGNPAPAASQPAGAAFQAARVPVGAAAGAIIVAALAMLA